MDIFSFLNFEVTPQLTNIILVILSLIIVWIVLRVALRFAMRVFSIGCFLILLFGLLLILLRYSG